MRGAYTTRVAGRTNMHGASLPGRQNDELAERYVSAPRARDQRDRAEAEEARAGIGETGVGDHSHDRGEGWDGVDGGREVDVSGGVARQDGPGARDDVAQVELGESGPR